MDRDKNQFVVTLEQMREYNELNEQEQQIGTEVRVTNEFYDRIIVIEYVQVFFAVFGVTMSIILNELKLK